MKRDNLYPFPTVHRDLDIPIPPKRIYLDVERFEEALYTCLRVVLALFVSGLGFICIGCSLGAFHVLGLYDLIGWVLLVSGLSVVVAGVWIGGLE